MRHLHRFASDFETLEIAVQRAGTALACPFASSAEFEAATIRAKRAAGIYGPKRRRRQAFLIVLAIAAGALLISLLP
jgi:hypothetical protein